MSSSDGNFKAPNFYPRVQLTTQEHFLVAKVAIPPFTTNPVVLVWGDRVFMHTGEVTEEDKLPIYNECFTYVVIHDSER